MAAEFCRAAGFCASKSDNARSSPPVCWKSARNSDYSPFEALACGIPLVSSYWEDAENLFTPGDDFLVVRNGAEVAEYVRSLTAEKAGKISEAAYRRVLAEHTYAHRAEQLEKLLDARLNKAKSNLL